MTYRALTHAVHRNNRPGRTARPGVRLRSPTVAVALALFQHLGLDIGLRWR